MWINHNYTYIPSLLSLPTTLLHPSPLGLHRALSWAPCVIQQLPILCMVVYICQCHALDLYHLLLPLQCLQVQFLSLCLYSCPANRLINTIFLDSIYNVFSSVQLLSHVWLFATPWTAACQASLSITNSWSPPKPMSIESVMPSNHLILCYPLLLLPSTPPSIRVFSNESALHVRWPKYWSFNFNISPSNEHQGLISFRMDWLDLLAVQGTLKSLLQHHSSKASILQRSAFFIVQLSNPYTTTGKTTALTRWTFVAKVISLLFNMLSRLVITFLPRSKRLSMC